ncbi:TRAP transporter large permease subunit [Gracilibacillus suaedae]|uniref:TRAP transporter large permease subunit n=1 Tax=Gracilibacillus suaedae TaxID=2820273 RepID=UPI001E64DF49|nr:TRAP transporter large permease subunit [Gracilibacillus suaedae]
MGYSTTPILLPVAMNVGIDPVHVGVLLILCLAVGLVTPSVSSTIGRIAVERASLGILTFDAAMIVILLVVAYFPQVSLFLRALFGYYPNETHAFCFHEMRVFLVLVSGNEKMCT